jgi:hypothetical protein
LELLLKLNAEVINIFAEHIVSGFLVIAKTDMSILSKHASRWATLFRILSISATHTFASNISFELTCLIISGHPDSPVTADHFGECVDLLLSFGSGILGAPLTINSTIRSSVSGAISDTSKSPPKDSR